MEYKPKRILSSIIYKSKTVWNITHTDTCFNKKFQAITHVVDAQQISDLYQIAEMFNIQFLSHSDVDADSGSSTFGDVSNCNFVLSPTDVMEMDEISVSLHSKHSSTPADIPYSIVTNIAKEIFHLLLRWLFSGRTEICQSYSCS